MSGGLLVGEEVKLHCKGRVFHGRVFCVDQSRGVVVLEEPHPQSTLKEDVRMLSLESVDKVEKVAPPSGNPAKLVEIPMEFLKKREADGLRKAQKEINRIGKGVTPEAQILFDTLDKTYRLKWRGKDMITELGIVISPPYTPESCTGRDQAALHRMKQIVDMINRRIKNGELKPKQ